MFNILRYFNATSCTVGAKYSTLGKIILRERVSVQCFQDVKVGVLLQLVRVHAHTRTQLDSTLRKLKTGQDP